MKLKLWIASLTLIACATPVAWAANESVTPPAPTPPAASVVPAATPEAKADVKSELQALVGKIKAKLQSGSKTEATLTEELKEFDVILAAHKGEKTDDVARVLMMKAMLYVEVFKDLEDALGTVTIPIRVDALF